MQMFLVEDQHVIQALSLDTQEKAFTDRIGSWRVIGRFQDLDAACCCNTRETGSKLAIIITDEILRCLFKRCGLPQLLCSPSVGRRARHTDMDHFPRFQLDDEERKKRTKEQISHLEEIAGPNLSHDCAETSSSFAPLGEANARPVCTSGWSVCRREYPASVIHPEYAQPPKASCSLPSL